MEHSAHGRKLPGCGAGDRDPTIRVEREYRPKQKHRGGIQSKSKTGQIRAEPTGYRPTCTSRIIPTGPHANTVVPSPGRSASPAAPATAGGGTARKIAPKSGRPKRTPPSEPSAVSRSSRTARGPGAGGLGAAASAAGPVAPSGVMLAAAGAALGLARPSRPRSAGAGPGVGCLRVVVLSGP